MLNAFSITVAILAGYSLCATRVDSGGTAHVLHRARISETLNDFREEQAMTDQ